MNKLKTRRVRGNKSNVAGIKNPINRSNSEFSKFLTNFSQEADLDRECGLCLRSRPNSAKTNPSARGKIPSYDLRTPAANKCIQPSTSVKT